ncbi:hypothetical protein HPB47_010688, partial [Ixodes persulcatus]
CLPCPRDPMRLPKTVLRRVSFGVVPTTESRGRRLGTHRPPPPPVGDPPTARRTDGVLRVAPAEGNPRRLVPCNTRPSSGTSTPPGRASAMSWNCSRAGVNHAGPSAARGPPRVRSHAAWWSTTSRRRSCH